MQLSLTVQPDFETRRTKIFAIYHFEDNLINTPRIPVLARFQEIHQILVNQSEIPPEAIIHYHPHEYTKSDLQYASVFAMQSLLYTEDHFRRTNGDFVIDLTKIDENIASDIKINSISFLATVTERSPTLVYKELYTIKSVYNGEQLLRILTINTEGADPSNYIPVPALFQNKYLNISVQFKIANTGSKQALYLPIASGQQINNYQFQNARSRLQDLFLQVDNFVQVGNMRFNQQLRLFNFEIYKLVFVQVVKYFGDSIFPNNAKFSQSMQNVKFVFNQGVPRARMFKDVVVLQHKDCQYYNAMSFKNKQKLFNEMCTLVCKYIGEQLIYAVNKQEQFNNLILTHILIQMAMKNFLSYKNFYYYQFMSVHAFQQMINMKAPVNVSDDDGLGDIAIEHDIRASIQAIYLFNNISMDHLKTLLRKCLFQHHSNDEFQNLLQSLALDSMSDQVVGNGTISQQYENFDLADEDAETPLVNADRDGRVVPIVINHIATVPSAILFEPNDRDQQNDRQILRLVSATSAQSKELLQIALNNLILSDLDKQTQRQYIVRNGVYDTVEIEKGKRYLADANFKNPFCMFVQADENQVNLYPKLMFQGYGHGGCMVGSVVQLQGKITEIANNDKMEHVEKEIDTQYLVYSIARMSDQLKSQEDTKGLQETARGDPFWSLCIKVILGDNTMQLDQYKNQELYDLAFYGCFIGKFYQKRHFYRFARCLFDYGKTIAFDEGLVIASLQLMAWLMCTGTQQQASIEVQEARESIDLFMELLEQKLTSQTIKLAVLALLGFVTDMVDQSEVCQHLGNRFTATSAEDGDNLAAKYTNFVLGWCDQIELPRLLDLLQNYFRNNTVVLNNMQIQLCLDIKYLFDICLPAPYTAFHPDYLRYTNTQPLDNLIRRACPSMDGARRQLDANRVEMDTCCFGYCGGSCVRENGSDSSAFECKLAGAGADRFKQRLLSFFNSSRDLSIQKQICVVMARCFGPVVLEERADQKTQDRVAQCFLAQQQDAKAGRAGDYEENANQYCIAAFVEDNGPFTFWYGITGLI